VPSKNKTLLRQTKDCSKTGKGGEITFMAVRRPAVAGYFYPGEPDKLRKELERCLPNPAPTKRAIGIVAPHAGYIYSGGVAGEVYQRVELPNRFIILSPNHTGAGEPYSIMPEGEWMTPLGSARIDEELAKKFMERCPLLTEDDEAHRGEHSLEVQIPFLQYLKKDFRFVPVTLSYIPYKACEEVGRALAQIIRESKEPILIIASSDMNHYESQQVAERKDYLAIEKIKAVDPEGLYETVKKNSISMCGIIPTTATLVAAKELGATKGELIRHATSGDVTGDYGSVVGYAGLIVS
jgi:AmmeMemoRadiSam system protein B